MEHPTSWVAGLSKQRLEISKGRQRQVMATLNIPVQDSETPRFSTIGHSHRTSGRVLAVFQDIAVSVVVELASLWMAFYGESVSQRLYHRTSCSTGRCRGLEMSTASYGAGLRPGCQATL